MTQKPGIFEGIFIMLVFAIIIVSCLSILHLMYITYDMSMNSYSINKTILVADIAGSDVTAGYYVSDDHGKIYTSGNLLEVNHTYDVSIRYFTNYPKFTGVIIDPIENITITNKFK